MDLDNIKQNSESTYVRIIKEICAEETIDLVSFSSDWVFRLKKDGKYRHIIGYQFELNSQAAGAICKDKCATSDVLTDNGVPCVMHHFFGTPSNLKYISEDGNWGRLSALLKCYGKLVCKPNEGTGGANVYEVQTQAELEAAAGKIFSVGYGMAVCKYYEIQNEYRVVVLNGKAELVFSKQIPHVVGTGRHTLIELISNHIKENDISGIKLTEKDALNRMLPDGEVYRFNWKHNLGQGAKPLIETDAKSLSVLSELALSAVKILNINFASIDIILTNNGHHILEINSGVMMEHFASHDKPGYLTAKNIYKKAILAMFQ